MKLDYEELRRYHWNILPKFDELLKHYTSVGVGGKADVLVTVTNLTELKQTLCFIRENNVSWSIVGKGTNTLVPDEGFPGVVISLKGEFAEINIDDTTVAVGSGATNRRLAEKAREKNLAGVEFLKSIPGTIGGAITMNAGAFKERISEIIIWVEHIDLNGSVYKQTRDLLAFDYRHSYFTDKPLLILKASLSLRYGDPTEIVQKERHMSDYRKKHHPIDKKTWGSVFLNPPEKSAGSLIESCGLKGKGFGEARISEKHANFIENTGNATFQDLEQTVEMARKAVLEKYGIRLKTEGKILGKNNE